MTHDQIFLATAAAVVGFTAGLLVAVAWLSRRVASVRRTHEMRVAHLNKAAQAERDLLLSRLERTTAQAKADLATQMRAVQATLEAAEARLVECYEEIDRLRRAESEAASFPATLPDGFAATRPLSGDK